MPKPKTGEKRSTNQPLKIDKLPPKVHDAILNLRNVMGKTWEEIEAISDVHSGEACFVEWLKLETRILELFPDMRLPHTTLHRWYDIRVDQVKREVLDRSAQARQIAEAFAKSVVKNGDAAVVNAARDTFMSVLAEDGSAKGRSNAAKALIVLAEVMNRARANDIKERKVKVDERKMAQMEKDAEIRRKRFQKEMDEAEKKVTRGEALTPEDINKIRQRVFGMGPAPVPANG